MKEKEAKEYLESLQGLGSRPGLDSIKELCRRLNNPQDQLKFIHIAGTNGKGSTASFITSILVDAGYKTGKYTSPAVFQYEERYQINQKSISKRKFAELLTKVRTAADQMELDGLFHPTVFEIETALAFLYFQEAMCDIVVLETGMGGRLDATNIIHNTIAAVFASISMDHMSFLGNTVEEIADEKAGIIKNNCYVISGIQTDQVTERLRLKSTDNSASFCNINHSDIIKIKNRFNNMEFSYKDLKKVKLAMSGEFQFENAALAIETIRRIQDTGFICSEENIRKGLLHTTWNGRLTMIRKKPLFIIDGAHNEDAAQKLGMSIANYFTNKKIVYIMGILKDKDVDSIIKYTCPYAEQIITVTTPNNPRAMQAYELAQVISKYHKSVTVADSLEEAVEMADLLVQEADMILAFGSLSYLGRLTEIVQNNGKCVIKSYDRSGKN